MSTSMDAHPTGLPMDTWGSGVTHWAAGDGYFAAMVDDVTDGKLPKYLTGYLKEIEQFSELDHASHQILPRPTVLVLCDENGIAVDADTSTPAVELLVAHQFPPGTTAEAALELAGYQITT